MADLSRRVDETLGGRYDVAWVIASGRLLIDSVTPAQTFSSAVPDLPPGTWVKDADRYPEPFTALGASVAAPAISTALTAMFTHYGALIERADLRFVGGEAYLRITPAGGHGAAPPPAWMLAVLARAVPSIRDRIRRAARYASDAALAERQQRWVDQQRPALRQEIIDLRGRDLTALDDTSLQPHLRDVLDLVRRALLLHFDLLPPTVVPLHALVLCCGRVLGWDERTALELLAGCSPATSSPGRALKEVAARIRPRPDVRRIVVALGDVPVDILVQRLTVADAETAVRLARWVDDFCFRPVHDDPGSPLFVEQPAMITRMLLEAGDRDRDPDDGSAVRTAARARARDLLARRPTERLAFERALEAAERAYPLREDSALWTGSLPAGLVRLVALEYGRRLVAKGQLDRPEDTVHLPIEGLLAALPAVAGRSAPTSDLRLRVAEHRAAREWARHHPGPARYGTAPPRPPDLRALPEPARRLNAALFWSRPATEAADSKGSTHPPPSTGVTGTGGSAGTFTGPVRLVLSAADFPRVRPGDVIVCRTTDPAWSVLFETAGAMVTDTGGLLSHAGIVAREYHLPAVLGTQRGTQILTEGQIVTVDGTSGRVSVAGPADTSELPSTQPTRRLKETS
ncbi:MAG: hypothetical protein L0H24_01910 [Microlunatus sp.]|nr:hypothetical protein [Microlunatus sp.]